MNSSMVFVGFGEFMWRRWNPGRASAAEDCVLAATPAAASEPATSIPHTNVFVVIISSPCSCAGGLSRRQLREWLVSRIELNAERIERHRDHPVVARCDQCIDDHGLVEAGAQVCPRAVGHE